MDNKYIIEYHPRHMTYEEARQYALRHCLEVDPRHLWWLLMDAERKGQEGGVDNGSD